MSWSLVGCIQMPVFIYSRNLFCACSMSGTAQHNTSLPDFLYTGLLSKNVLGLTELSKQS